MNQNKFYKYVIVTCLAFIMLLIVLYSAFSYTSTNEFTYTITENQCILVNPLNTNILTGEGNISLTFNYNCDDSLNESIRKLNELYSNGSVKCMFETSDVTSKLNEEFTTEMTLMRTDISDTIEIVNTCGGCATQLVNCEMSKTNQTIKEGVFNEQLSLKNTQIDLIKGDLKTTQYLCVILLLMVLACLFIITTGGDFSRLTFWKKNG